MPTPPLPIPADDKDLADQARPGHGVPSQDPDSAAQFTLNPEEAQRESDSVLKAGGMVAGAATGAAAAADAGIGVLVGGEVARYIARHGQSRLHSVVFAAAVPPCLMQSADNPEGPLTPDDTHASRQAWRRTVMLFLRPSPGGFSPRTACCASASSNAMKPSPCVVSRRKMRRWPAWTLSVPPTSAAT